MIKINLLPHEKRTTSIVYYQIIGAGAVIILALIVVGAFSLYYSNQVRQKKAEVREKEQTVKELQIIIDQVLQFEKDKESLKMKLDTIETLQRNQKGPVLLLEEISKSLPEQVWLYQLQNVDRRVVTKGYALTQAAIGDLITSLSNSRLIRSRSVTLNNSLLRQRDNKDYYEFEIVFRLKKV